MASKNPKSNPKKMKQGSASKGNTPVGSDTGETLEPTVRRSRSVSSSSTHSGLRELQVSIQRLDGDEAVASRTRSQSSTETRSGNSAAAQEDCAIVDPDESQVAQYASESEGTERGGSSTD